MKISSPNLQRMFMAVKMSVKNCGAYFKKNMVAIAECWKIINMFKNLNIGASCVRFLQNVNGLENLPESNFGLVLKTKWLPYHIFYVKCGVISKSPNISLIIGLGDWNVKTTSWKSWSANLLQVSNFTFQIYFKVM